MNISHSLLFIFALTPVLPLTMAEPLPPPPAAEEEAPLKQEASPVLRWREFLQAALVDPNRKWRDRELPEKFEAFLSAAARAREAQLAYGLYSFSTLARQYPTAQHAERRQAMPQEYTALVNELFQLDILAFAANFEFRTDFPMQLLITDFTDLLPMHPGEQDFSEEPGICKALLEKPLSGSVPHSDTLRHGLALWQEQLINTHTRLSLTYGAEEGEDEEKSWELQRELLSGGHPTSEEYDELCVLFDKLGQTWEEYYEAARTFAKACAAEYGGLGYRAIYNISMVQRCLLDSYSRLLSSISRGFDHEDARARTPDTYQLHSPSTAYGFGRLHTTTALLFRHPRMEGSPWCITFRYQGYCRSFRLLEDSPALRRLEQEHPGGGIFKIKGYHSVRSSGSPLPETELVDIQHGAYFDDTRVRYPAPEKNAYRIHATYHIVEVMGKDNES